MRQVTYLKSEDRIKFNFQYNPNIEKELTNLGCQRISEGKFEIRPFKHKLLPILKFINKWGFEIEDSFEELLKIKFKVSRIAIQPFSNENSINIPLKNKVAKKLSNELKLTYRDYQIDGVTYMVEKKRCVNGDDVGLGKTCQSIGAVSYLDAFPVLINCPAYLKINWKREWEKWTNKSIYIVEEPIPVKDIPKSDVYIINYEKPYLTTRGYKRQFKEDLKKLGVKSVVIDESHYLKNSKTKRYRAIKSVIRKLDIRFLLTGTFSLGSPFDTMDQLKLIDRFDEFMGGKNENNWENFVVKYCNGYLEPWGWNKKGSSNLKEFHEKLRDLCYIRREQNEVAKDIPEKDFIEVRFELTNKSEYKKAESDLLSYVQKEYGKEKAELASRAEGLTKISYLRKLALKGKMESIYSFIDDFLENSKEKLVVFGVRVEPLLQLAINYDADMLTGEVSRNEKQRNIDEFQSNESKRLIFIDVVDGITLTAANNILFIEEPEAWKEYQAIGRIGRIGQTKRMRVIFAIADDTIDEDVRVSNIEDLKVMDSINKGIDVQQPINKVSMEEKLFKMFINKCKNLGN